MGIFDWFKDRFGNPSPQPTPAQLPPDSNLSVPAIPQQIQPDSNFSLTEDPNQIPPYVEGFEQALRFTKSLGYDTTSLSLGDVGTDLLDPQGNFDIPVFKAAGIVDRENQAGNVYRSQSAAQCLKWSHYLQPFFQDQLGMRVMLTTGQLWRNKERIYGPTFEQVRRWNESGLQHADLSPKGGLLLHAWLTLESGEIIDPTLLSSLAEANSEVYKNYAGGNIWDRDPLFFEGQTYRYVPVTVGSEIIEHIVRLTTIPEGAHFLASKLSDLVPIPRKDPDGDLTDFLCLLKNGRL